MYNLTGLFNFSHYIDPAKKDAKWASKVIYELYSFGDAKSLLFGKDPQAIRDMVDGKQSPNRYKKMFRRMSKELANNAKAGGLTANPEVTDITGIDWQPVAILSQPINSAITSLQKTPLYVKCTAIDGLAQDKKKKDYDYMRQRPELDRVNATIGEQTGIALNSPKAPNNAENVDIVNFDLDPTKEDELNFFMNMFYRLRPESAFESTLQALSYILGLKSTMDLAARDQMLYGVDSHTNQFSQMTGLPLTEYQYPGDVYTPDSALKDFNDQPFRYILKHATCEEVMNAVGNEIENDGLVKLFDNYFESKGWGQRWNTLDDRQRKKATIPMCYIEFKTWDIQQYHSKKVRASYKITEEVGYGYELRYSSKHPDKKLRGQSKKANADEYIEKKFVQRTLTSYWFPSDPDRVYRYKELEGSFREAGKESMSPFSINIYKSQEKGAAELCEGLVHSWHRAYYKWQHCIINSKPAGMFIDMRYMRNAISQSQGTDMKLSTEKLFMSLAENNLFIGDSEGIDPTETMSGSRPFYEIKGGVGAELEGYIIAMNEAKRGIAEVTGINEALTGGNNNTSNPEGLVGLQKLLLQSGMNSIYYAQQARKEQTEKVYRMWAHMVQHILSHKNTPSYKAIESIIGAYKTTVLEDLHTIPAHMWAIMVENAPTEVEQEQLNQMLNEMFISQNINSVDYVTLKRIYNYKDAQQLLAIRERKNRERKVAEQQSQQEAALQGIQIKAQTDLQKTQIMASAPVQAATVKAEADKWLAQFKSQTDAILATMNGNIKNELQENRSRHQLQKNKQSADLKTQQPLPAA